MAISGISLRQLVEKYVEAGEKEGLSTVDMCLEILETQCKDFEYYSLWLMKACENIQRKSSEKPLVDPQMDINTYLVMMQKILGKRAGREVSNLEAIATGVNILYTIHQKKYIGVEEFLKSLKNKFGMLTSTTRLRILGTSPTNLYVGLMACTSRYFTKADNASWRSKSEQQRLEALERAENLMYKDMVEEWRRSTLVD